MKDEKDIQPIDKLFRQSLEGYSPAPPASVWKQIRSRVPGKSSATGKWFGSPGGISILSAVGLIGLSWIIYKSAVKVAETAKPTQTISVSVDSVSKQELTSETDKAANTNLTLITGEKTPGIDPKPIEKPSESSHKSVSIEPSDSANSNNTTLNLKQTTPEITTKESAAKAVNITPEQPDKKDISILNNKQTISNSAQAENVFSSDADTIQALIERSAPVEVKLLQEADYKNYTASETNKAEKPVGNTLQNSKGKDTKPAKLKTKDFVGQVGFSGNVGQVYQKDRNTNLYYGGLITAGLWNTHWNAGIETGLGVSQYADYGDEITTRVKTVLIITYDTTWNMQDSVPVINTHTTTEQSFSTDSVHYTYSYSYLHIPLYFTKQIANFGKFALDFKTGPSVSFIISQKQTSSFTPVGDSSVLFNSEANNYSRLNVSWQMYFSPQVRWDISDNISVFVCPAVVLFLNNLYDKKNRPASTPYGLSIYGGLTYKFH